MIDKIIVKGARENNLKNVSFEFPKNKLVVFTGVSGSGKSSMAFDTLFAEGQRRYVESLSSYARQFLGNMKRPDVDLIDGLSPSIAINQKAISHNPRSTVGTVTEIYDYLRLLFARVGHPYCPECGREVSPQSSKQIVTQIINTIRSEINNIYRFFVLSPVIKDKKGDFKGLIENLKKQGYKWIRVDNKIIDLYTDFGIARTNRHNIEVIIDRVSVSKDNLKDEKSLYDRLVDDVEQAMKLANGLVIVSKIDDPSLEFPTNPKEFKDTLFSENFACPNCNISLPEIEPRLFSFNSPQGACPECKGLGNKYQIDRSKFPEWRARMMESRYLNSGSDAIRDELEKFMIKTDCPECHGARLNQDALSVHILGQNIYQITQLPIEKLDLWLNELDSKLGSEKEKEILDPIRKELTARIEFLLAVGLDYLSLDREAGTLSSGESQRIRLASQIGTGLTGVLYILDEPTIGLHSRDNDRLITTLQKLKDLGNSVIVVEHDEDVIKSADEIIDFGPYAGKNGGEIVAQGNLEDIKKNNKSLTGKYLSGKLKINDDRENKSSTIHDSKHKISITNCHQWNLKNINVEFPLNKLVCVTGVSGSGKSTLVHDTLYGGVRKTILGAYYGTIGKFDKITGAENVSDVLLVDQSPIGRTPRSNPATYTKIFDDIRLLMSQTIEAQIRGFNPNRFSFNVKDGRCPACEGQGLIKIEMQFLPDIYVTCDECHGSRFKEETLEVDYKGKNIAEILKMTIDEAAEFFKNLPRLKRKLETIQSVGLGYLELGQPSNTLSGGESQRLKISRELVKKENGKMLYILDEPTTGLHFYDVDKLIKVLRQLVDKGNTVVVIEHNLDMIKNSDWIIDMGPEGGEKGGKLVVAGTVQDVIDCPQSYTGQYLKKNI